MWWNVYFLLLAHKTSMHYYIARYLAWRKRVPLQFCGSNALLCFFTLFFFFTLHVHYFFAGGAGKHTLSWRRNKFSWGKILLQAEVKQTGKAINSNEERSFKNQAVPLKQILYCQCIFSPSTEEWETLLHLTKYTQYPLRIVKSYTMFLSCLFFWDILPWGTWHQVNPSQESISSDTSVAALQDERL